MGSSSSKFRKHLQNGDEYAALQLYYSSSDLRKGLDPNSSYGDTYNHDTPLHYAARHAMKSLLRVFLNELGGNPNKKNIRNETPLLCVCMVATTRLNYAIQQRRLECLSLVLQWRGGTLENGEVERVDLSTQDEKLNTALHYAAASGLKRCVEFLVGQNAPMFTENLLKQTPCDSAEKNGHNEIALFLESKMVFHNEDENTDELDNLLDEMEAEEGYSGLRAQDLQEAKDQLLVETSDMLHVPLFTAEALLRNHEWSREMLLEAWMADAVLCCEKCGVVPPVTIYEQQPSTSSRVTRPSSVHQIQIEHDLRTPTHSCPPVLDTTCDICANPINPAEEPVPMLCDDRFCRQCWERYLSVKIQEGEAHNITCPGFQCEKLVPAEIIETLVSRDMARRYLQFDIKAFVESNPSIKWCPYPGCGRAVRLPDSDNPLSPTFRGLSDMDSQKDTSHSVDCGNGHMFCWECLGEAHEPSSCENWEAWHSKIAEVKPEQMNGTEEETEMAANCLWLITNSKPCPNCKSPIQKNEGCNHMKCSKCKHDFCWVCQEGWKKHSSATGGYFRCNRYEAVKRVEDSQDNMKNQAESKNRRMQELNRFVHYYTRFKNHENSFKLEEPLLNTAKDKMMVLAKAVTDQETANLETKFVEDAVVQILKARRVLKCSYVYGFYLDDSGYKKPIFEFMQTELEECTETLSEMVARPYLRTPRTKIIQTAHLVQRKRQEFVTAIAKGLVPPDSPSMRRKRKKFNVEVDDDLRKALLASMQDLDPANPWIKDPSGKHTNVSALLDWPEESDSEEDSSPVPVRRGLAKLRPLVCIDDLSEEAMDPEQLETELEQAELPEPCLREGCSKPRVVNPRTGEVHQHCCMKCMRLDRMERAEGSKSEATCELFSDYQMDLLRALEMSRLQFMQEMGSLRPGTGDRSPIPSSSRPISEVCTFDKSPRTSSPNRSPCLSLSQNPYDSNLPSIILCDPPPGKNRPIRGLEALESAMIDQDETKANRLMGDIDGELERALRISQISVQDDDHDLRLAIELSLLDSTSGVASTASAYQGRGDHSGAASTAACAPTQGDGDPMTRMTQADTLSTEYSSIVTRVPNKSIEDLAVDNLPLPASSENSLLEASGDGADAAGKLSPPTDSIHSSQPVYNSTTQGLRYHFLDPVAKGQGGSETDRSNPVQVTKGHGSPSTETEKSNPVQTNPFGLIKDISVLNIIASDTDKIKDFSDKDLSQVFDKRYTCDRGDRGDTPTEGRPSPSFTKLSRWHTAHSGRYCPKPADYKFDRDEDPWLRQTNQQDQCPATSLQPHSGCTSRNEWSLPTEQHPASSHDSRSQLPIPRSPNTDLHPRSPRAVTQSPAAPPHRNPEESLEHALQNLNDLTRNLTRVDSLDSVDMVIDSKVLESLLQGAEGYAKVSDDDGPHAQEFSYNEGHGKEADDDELPAPECVDSVFDGNEQPAVSHITDLDLEQMLESAPLVPPNADLDRMAESSMYQHTPLVYRPSQSEPADEEEPERDGVYV